VSGDGIDDEVRAALRELVEHTGAVSARITLDDGARSGVPARTLALGGGEFLRVELSTRHPREVDLEGALERLVRQLRAIRRRWEATRLPELVVASAVEAPSGDRVLERVVAFLRGLAGADRARNAVLTRHGKLLAAAQPPTEADDGRWPFLARRVLASHAPASSHGEVVDPDAFAISFWYDAALIVLLDEPYAVDFIRHRARHVARELANLLPGLEPDPSTPIAVRKRPPTLG
jgi:hypothetical protein